MTSELHSTPRVWALTSHRSGERTQILALAERLGWPCVIKNLHYRGSVPYFLLGASRAGVDTQRSDPLEAEWPDLVITAGARNEPVARWIRARAGKPVRLIHIGRTWAPLRHFDLVITTPQYRLRNRPNVLQNTTTLHRVTPTLLKHSAERWKARISELPRPYVGVLVGGHSGPYSFDRNAALRLARQASDLARARGGSLLVSTSARTPASASAYLRNAISVPSHFYAWRASDEDNPYYAYLQLADEHVVTGDSISMLTEACATTKPVYIFDVGRGNHAMRAGLTQGEFVKPPADERPHWNSDGPRAAIYRLAMTLGPRRLTRDIRIVHRKLIDSGRAVWLGETFPPERPPPLDDMDRAVERVRQLVDADPHPVPPVSGNFS